jgi:transposase
MIVSPLRPLVGIDIGKFTCVAAVHGGPKPFAFAPDAEGVASFIAFLRRLPAAPLVGFEATGGYEAVLWEALDAAGFAARQLPPPACMPMPGCAGVWPRRMLQMP